MNLEIPKMDKLGWEGMYNIKSMKIVSFIVANNLGRRGCSAFLDIFEILVQILLLLSQFPCLSEFQEVLPIDFLSIPPE